MRSQAAPQTRSQSGLRNFSGRRPPKWLRPAPRRPSQVENNSQSGNWSVERGSRRNSFRLAPLQNPFQLFEFPRIQSAIFKNVQYQLILGVAEEAADQVPDF